MFNAHQHGFKHNVRLANCTGVIDSDYRGEVLVKITIDEGFFQFKPGDRLAQLVVVPFLASAIEVDELSQTKRGTAGRGSTGG